MQQRWLDGVDMHRQLNPQDKDTGMTLIELAVAVLILAMGSIAALRAVDQSRHAIGGSEDRVLAQLIARNRAEELKMLGITSSNTLPSTIEMGGQNFSLSTTTKITAAGLTEATVTARAARGGGALYVVYLPRGIRQ